MKDRGITERAHGHEHRHRGFLFAPLGSGVSGKVTPRCTPRWLSVRSARSSVLRTAATASQAPPAGLRLRAESSRLRVIADRRHLITSEGHPLADEAQGRIAHRNHHYRRDESPTAPRNLRIGRPQHQWKSDAERRIGPEGAFGVPRFSASPLLPASLPTGHSTSQVSASVVSITPAAPMAAPDQRKAFWRCSSTKPMPSPAACSRAVPISMPLT